MTDDPNRKREDGWFVSSQPHEYAYFKAAIRKECPEYGEQAIEEAIGHCRAKIAPSEGRTKLTECVRRRLRGY